MRHTPLAPAAAFALALVLAGVLALASAACDPVHDDAIAALGDEAPGVRKGPTHRPGQPCVTCHDGAIGSPPQFSVAGTVYQNETDKSPANGVSVVLTDETGHTFTATTNTAGNFYVTPKEFTPFYPMTVSLSNYGQFPTVTMKSRIGRDGSCADCHSDPAGPTSAGHIFAETTDGGTP